MAWRAFGNPQYTKRMIAMAKKILDPAKAKKPAKGTEKEVCFAFMPDKATGEHEFALDTGIEGEMLFKKLRTHCNAERGKQKKKKLTKGAWGKCRIQGKTLYVTPDQDVPSLRMLLKKRLLSKEFKEFKLNECRILKPGQEPPPEAEDAGEEEEAQAATSAKTAQTTSEMQEEEEAQAAQTSGGAAPQEEEEAQASAGAAPQEEKEAQASQSSGGAEPQEQQSAQAAATGDVNPFSGEATAATATTAAPSKKAAQADPKQAAKDKKDAQKKRAAFKKARQSWVTTRETALADLEVVKDAFRKEYMDDPQIKDVNKRIKELDAVMDDLGDDLREALDAYVATPLGQKKALDEQAAKARKLLKKFSGYVDKSQLLAAVDGEKGVGDASKVKVKAPLAKALKSLAKTIG